MLHRFPAGQAPPGRRYRVTCRPSVSLCGRPPISRYGRPLISLYARRRRRYITRPPWRKPNDLSERADAVWTRSGRRSGDHTPVTSPASLHGRFQLRHFHQGPSPATLPRPQAPGTPVAFAADAHRPAPGPGLCPAGRRRPGRGADGRQPRAADGLRHRTGQFVQHGRRALRRYAVHRRQGGGGAHYRHDAAGRRGPAHPHGRAARCFSGRPHGPDGNAQGAPVGDGSIRKTGGRRRRTASRAAETGRYRFGEQGNLPAVGSAAKRLGLRGGIRGDGVR